MRRPGGLYSSGSTPQDIWVGGDRASVARSRSGRSTSRVERARPSGRRQHCSAQNAGSIHDWVVRRVETARIGLKRTPRFHLAPRGGQNSARPGYGAILHEECALDALKGGFWLPGRFVCIRGRAPAQDGHPSAGAAHGVPNANLPLRWSLLTTPSPKPYVPQSVGLRAGGAWRVWVGLSSG